MTAKNHWPCPGKPEERAGQPIGMYHCEFCGEMQLAGSPHLPPQCPSAWEAPFPTVDESAMVAYPTSPVTMERVEPVGPPHTRPPLSPPSSFPAPPAAAADDAAGSEKKPR
ncbi:MAG TPA: hypothetical protein VLE97_07375 [Gaiellaceae bacterium]|nr:hypothetical protein [Gaiellaceae bacterium]